ncbi:hypothetical protein [Botrimarina hoheduenensis]|uniref:J domain-containing protein n=1 Tax=Botrimarina hoheduenensis TaxID=2528000 RepID=A0A5C5VV73_9BACT|nr:hypothetical protein [Botrimarina hoheduenensis]TWT41432.1 hypothetical protein Pla111_31470 [Botrimarina hoheduenensis]
MTDEPKPEGSEPTAAPDWSLLPRHPEQFFGLTAGFDRRVLKQSYNRLLRRYKPEKYPQEFQKLRAAYEELERRLRYSGSRHSEEEPTPWRTASAPTRAVNDTLPAENPASSAPPSARKRSPSRDLKTLVELLESRAETPEQLYQQLCQVATKSPPDYYALAVLSEVVLPNQPNTFLSWLVKGLKQWPHDAGLGRLLYEVLRLEVPLAQLPKYLISLSKSLSSDCFYELTEGGWQRLLQSDDLQQFAHTIKVCEQHQAGTQQLGDSLTQKLTFTLQALRYTLWKDRTDWSETAWDFIEDHDNELPNHLHQDLDVLAYVRQYLAVREDFIAIGPLNEELDRVLHRALTSNQLESDEAMQQINLRLLDNPALLSASFPIDGPEVSIPFYILWRWAAEEAAARYAAGSSTDQEIGLWMNSIRESLPKTLSKTRFTNTLWKCTVHLKNWLVWGTAIVTAGVVLVTTTAAILVPLSSLVKDRSDFQQATTAAAVIVAIACAVVTLIYTLKFQNSRIDKNWEKIPKRFARSCYRQAWRKDAFDFLKHSHLDYFSYAQLIQRQSRDDWRAGLFVELVQRDYALAMYSIAQQFRL